MLEDDHKWVVRKQKWPQSLVIAEYLRKALLHGVAFSFLANRSSSTFCGCSWELWILWFHSLLHFLLWEKNPLDKGQKSILCMDYESSSGRPEPSLFRFNTSKDVSSSSISPAALVRFPKNGRKLTQQCIISSVILVGVRACVNPLDSRLRKDFCRRTQWQLVLGNRTC